MLRYKPTGRKEIIPIQLLKKLPDGKIGNKEINKAVKKKNWQRWKSLILFKVFNLKIFSNLNKT